MNLVLSERLNDALKLPCCHRWNLEDVEMQQNEPDLTALPINDNVYVIDYNHKSFYSHLIIRCRFWIFTLTYDITASF
jgi:hypothetical protein